jgi:hypothetical protein
VRRPVGTCAKKRGVFVKVKVRSERNVLKEKVKERKWG